MLNIANKKELDSWMWERRDRSVSAIKGKPPKGATYDDGTVIINDINIGWRDNSTGEEIRIVYE